MSKFSFCTLMYATIVSLLGFSPAFAQLSNVTTPTLNLTAISAANGASTLECWQLSGVQTSATAGTSGALSLFLGDVSNATYTVIPSRFNGGVHNAPAAQLVQFLSGLIHVTLPNTTTTPTTEAWVQGGKFGLIIAADTPDVSKYGHISTYPTDSDTVALQIPFKAGYIPEHTVLYPGPCQWSELVGI